MAGKVVGWLIYFAVLAIVTFVGWREPLRYRFLSRAEIHAIEHPAPPPSPTTPPPPKPGEWMNDPKRPTKLDDGPRDNQRTTYRPPGTPHPVPAR